LVHLTIDLDAPASRTSSNSWNGPLFWLDPQRRYAVTHSAIELVASSRLGESECCSEMSPRAQGEAEAAPVTEEKPSGIGIELRGSRSRRRQHGRDDEVLVILGLTRGADSGIELGWEAGSPYRRFQKPQQRRAFSAQLA
jgi:hypothetical protein